MDEGKRRHVIEQFLDIFLLFLLMMATVAIVRLRNLVAVAMLLALYSFLMAAVWVVLDAVDVALTEAAVGAGVSTILMLAAVSLTSSSERAPTRGPLIPLVLVLLTGAVLLYATADMPALGDPGAPAQRHVAPRYIRDTRTEIGIPNMVTAVLASYRGYDTLGEVTVIFTAGIGVLLLLARRRKERS